MKKAGTILIISIIACFVGCGPMPDIVSTEKKPGEKYSADEVRRITVDQPFLLSGDYFRDREPDTYISLNFSGDVKEKSIVAAKTEDAPKASANTEEKPVVEISKDGPPLKTGFIYSKQADANTAETLNRALQKAAGTYPVLITDPTGISEALEGSSCPKRDDIDCISKSLGVYPGIRMLVVVEISLPGNLPGKALVKAEVIDTGIGFHYSPFEIDAEIATPPENDAFVDAAVRNILGSCLKKRDAIPWFCRVFSNENGRFHINAGGKSGLKPGDRLKTVRPGKLVKNPGGMPAGWIPGESKGMMKVDVLFGEDFAACSLVEGEPPLKEDMLVMAK